MTPPFFAEPTEVDPRPGMRGESTLDFLHRSTWRRAAEIRAFYNEALEALPAASHRPLLAALEAGRTSSVLLEIVVGRFLQLRGAISLEHEPASHGRQVDWRARFPDGVLHVEAMAPNYNAGSGETARRQQRMLDVLDARAPIGWWIMPMHLPPLEGHASLGPFRRLVDHLIARLPPSDSMPAGAFIDLHDRLPQGRVELVAVRAKGQGGVGGAPIISHWDDSERVIRRSWMDARKRKQGRSVPAPALLAMAGSFLGADLEAFEMALFGRDVRRGRQADGAMVEGDPPWTGVLAFPMISPATAPDPVVFLAPGYQGALPSAVDRLEVRRLAEGGLEARPARDTDVMAGLRLAAA